jgi:SAM-dependent methyltransferase
MDELNFTGERLVTSVKNNHGVTEHLHRYAIALEYCRDKEVLDIASGEGYGSNLLSKTAKKVYGVDIDVDAINHANKKYSNSRLEFIHGNTSEIPLKNSSMDVVVSFETIEHHDEHNKMMDEIKRVLRKDGLLIISSPEKSIYKERDPMNVYHIKELTSNEFKELLSRYFHFTAFLSQRYISGSLISPDNTTGSFNVYNGNYNCINKSFPEHTSFYNKPYFNLAICSDAIFEKKVNTSFFDGSSDIISEINRKENKLRIILDSDEYRLGKFILRHFKFLKKLKKFKKI